MYLCFKVHLFWEEHNFFSESPIYFDATFFILKKEGEMAKKIVAVSQNLNFNMTKVVEQIILGHS